jgi:hypothetical protein
MPLTREERKLLHQKSKQPTFGVNKPDAREGHEGDIAYRRVEGSGTVQYVKENGDWTAIASSGKMPKSRNIITAPSSSRTAIIDHGDLAGLGNDNHTQYLLISGDRAMTGNLDMGSQSIVSVVNVTASGTVQAEQLTSTDDAQIGDDLTVFGDITVDGEAKLDKTTIDTADGKFTASGANNIELTTTGTHDINLTSGQDLDVGVGNNYELDVTRNCTWNTQTTNWSNSNTFTLTSLGNITIETDGTDGDSSGNDDSSNTILIKNANSNNADFTGIHIKTDSQGAANAHNDILIECDNVAAKGSTFGVDIRSENNIRIRSENNNSGQSTALLMRATGPIDLGVGDASTVTQHTTNDRVKIHGTNGIEFATLYRASGSTAINTTDATFDKIDTLNLVRAMTHKATSSSVTNGSYVSIVNGDNDDNQMGTVWRVTIFYKLASGSSSGYFQIWHCYASLSDSLSVVSDINVSVSGSDTSAVTWESGAATDSDPKGIKWTNGTGSTVSTFRASALKIQGASDF